MQNSSSILLVESNDFLKTSLQEALKFYGYNVTTAKSAEKGLFYLEKDMFDAVISDYDLIDRRGEHFLLEAKNQQLVQVAILMVPDGELENYKKYNKCGIDVVIEKPFPFRAMLQLIERLIQKTQKQKSPEVV